MGKSHLDVCVNLAWITSENGARAYVSYCNGIIRRFQGRELRIPRLPEACERKQRSENLTTALLCMHFLNGYSSRPYIGGVGNAPIRYLTGQSAVNIPSFSIHAAACT